VSVHGGVGATFGRVGAPASRQMLCAFAAATIVLLGACTRASAPRELTFAAAASLRNVMPELQRAYEASHAGVHVVATFGASGDLKKQVEGGAPIDGVIFASARPVKELADAGRVRPPPRVVATNTLVLVGPQGGPKLTFATLAALPAGEHLAIGDPGAVPAGEYARAWLTSLGTWEQLGGRLVLGGDVGAVLAYARRGEVAAAIVYRTDAQGVADVVILDEARGPNAPRPEVVAAVVEGARAQGEATAFLAFLAAPEGQRILREFGFGPP
jgi:molybdate transport system substrate-binding protein